MNGTYLIPIRDTIETAWQKVSGSKLPIWGAFGLVFLIMFCFGLVSGAMQFFTPKLAWVFGAIMELFGVLLQAGILYLGIQRAKDSPIAANLVFRAVNSSLAWKVIAVMILVVLILVIPILFEVAGLFLTITQQNTLLQVVGCIISLISSIAIIYLAIRMKLSIGFVVDRESDPWQAIQQSFNATRCNVWRLIGIYLIQALIVFISAIPLGIGLIWTIPFSLILYGTMYQRLSQNNV